MVIEKGHAHAYTKTKCLDLQVYLLLFISCLECKLNRFKTLTVHLPYEIQHKELLDINKALRYIRYGEALKSIFSIRLMWENAPWIRAGTWDLKFGNTEWSKIPKWIDVCLDTGHLMLGCKNRSDFINKLNQVLRNRGRQIKFLHLNENDFKHDDHNPVPGRVLNKRLMGKLIAGREWIIEKPWS